MKINEAIEHMQNEINNHAEVIENYTAAIMEAKVENDVGTVAYYEVMIKHHQNQLEYKSIILESAKILHEIIIPLRTSKGVEIEIEYEILRMNEKGAASIGLEFDYLEGGEKK